MIVEAELRYHGSVQIAARSGKTYNEGEYGKGEVAKEPAREDGLEDANDGDELANCTPHQRRSQRERGKNGPPKIKDHIARDRKRRMREKGKCLNAKLSRAP